MTDTAHDLTVGKRHNKRRHEEVVAGPGNNGDATTTKVSKEERREAKKLKRVNEIRTERDEEPDWNFDDTKEEKREAKRLKKLENANGRGEEAVHSVKVAIVHENTGNAGNVPKSKTPKEERKEAKRLEKLDKLANGRNQHVVEEGLTAKVGERNKDSVKAVHKAEKAQAKTSKNAEDNANVEAQSVPILLEEKSNGKTKDNSKRTAIRLKSKAGYQEDPSLTALPQSDIDAFLSTNFISIKDPSSTSPLRPITEFSYLPKTATSPGTPFSAFKIPTPIQSAAWPFVLSGRDVIGVAETGSGKTLAFGVPCIRSITTSSSSSKGSAPAKAVIVSPTRELAVQIHAQIETLATPASLSTVCVYGGVPKDQQRAVLKTAHIIVATPGRLNDLINEGAANLSNVTYCVLDEADRMLDKGFEEEIRKIISTTSAKGRQTLMFTATWPPSVRELAATFMTQPVHISIGEDNPTSELRANTKIKQLVEVVDPRGKEQRLLQLLKQHQGPAKKNDRILVFCLYKKEAARIEGFLRQRGLKVAGIHGDMGQAARQASLDSFKSGSCPLLVATDVAARGLDIPAVKVVVNVTFPLTVEDYVHRIGRTGRAGAEGLAITLFTEHDKAQSGALINVMRAANQEIPEDLLKFGTTVKKKGHEAYGAFYRDTGAERKKSTKIKFDD